MSLMKSKINSLAWLKFAISISVVGGVILSSKPAESAMLTLDDPELGTYFAQQIFPGSLPAGEALTGNNWQGQVGVVPIMGGANDFLSISGFFQHKNIPLHGHTSGGEQFTFNLSLSASDPKDPNTNNVTRTTTALLPHGNHSDSFLATLTAVILSPATSENHIVNWTLNLEGKHRSEPVPEPTTIFGSALALSLGGWLKQKKSSQRHKTAPQH